MEFKNVSQLLRFDLRATKTKLLIGLSWLVLTRLQLAFWNDPRLKLNNHRFSNPWLNFQDKLQVYQLLRQNFLKNVPDHTSHKKKSPSKIIFPHCIVESRVEQGSIIEIILNPFSTWWISMRRNTGAPKGKLHRAQNFFISSIGKVFIQKIC